MYFTHYLTDLAERMIDSGCCFGAYTRTHVRQRKAREERVRYHAVQHAKAAGNIGIVTSHGREARARAEPVRRQAAAAAHVLASPASACGVRAPARAGIAGSIAQRYGNILWARHPQMVRSAPAYEGR